MHYCEIKVCIYILTLTNQPNQKFYFFKSKSSTLTMKFLKQKKEYKDLISVLKNVFKNQNFTIFFGVVDNLCMINVFFGQICNLVLDVQPEIQILY